MAATSRLESYFYLSLVPQDRSYFRARGPSKGTIHPLHSQNYWHPDSHHSYASRFPLPTLVSSARKLSSIAARRSHGPPSRRAQHLRDLLPEILREWKQPPYWAIGVSKLMCVGCYAMLAKAFPKAPFTIQGSHGKMHRPWVAPDLSFATQILGFDLDSAMRSGAEEYIRDTLSNYVEQRSLSDGSVGSAISSRMELEGSRFKRCVDHSLDYAESAIQRLLGGRALHEEKTLHTSISSPRSATAIDDQRQE
ncbi:hypothetical protein B0H13DRAFT_2524663 [Mycena leptocephala]|nr:hypothetical protein B0H13DRAFT_2524663 [Mycena leptocephala]